MEQRQVFITVGLIGAGKTTWARKLRDDYVAAGNKLAILESDIVRTLANQRSEYCFIPENEDMVKMMGLNIAATWLQAGYSVVLDDAKLLNTLAKRQNVKLLLRQIVQQSINIEFITADFPLDSDLNLKNRLTDDPRGYTAEEWQQAIDNQRAEIERPTLKEGTVIYPVGKAADKFEVISETTDTTSLGK
jgi:predicted kinase